MKRISKDLKRILNGLACQHAGEYLSIYDKMKVLGSGSETTKKMLARTKDAGCMQPRKRIALISDGGEPSACLDYAIDASLRQDAQIDLLIHNVIDKNKLPTLESRIQQAGVNCQRIRLGAKAIDDTVTYIYSHPSLIFVVALPNDYVARTLVEEVIPQRLRRVPVPLVLIGDQATARQIKRPAA